MLRGFNVSLGASKQKWSVFRKKTNKVRKSVERIGPTAEGFRSSFRVYVPGKIKEY